MVGPCFFSDTLFWTVDCRWLIASFARAVEFQGSALRGYDLSRRAAAALLDGTMCLDLKSAPRSEGFSKES